MSILQILDADFTQYFLQDFHNRGPHSKYGLHTHTFLRFKYLGKFGRWDDKVDDFQDFNYYNKIVEFSNKTFLRYSYDKSVRRKGVQHLCLYLPKEKRKSLNGKYTRKR